MATQTAISLGVLQVNWDERRKDYLDNFVPIVAECVRLQNTDVVSTGILKTEIESRFGLDIPASAVNTILRRLSKDRYVYVQDGVYYRDTATLSSLNFREIQQNVLRMHDALISDMLAYSDRQFGLHWSPEDAANSLLSCLKENDLHIISAFTAGTLIPDSVLSTRADRYHCALYIKHLEDTASPLLDYLRKLCEGHMLANAIFLPDLTRASQRFRNTEVFFDTSFLIFALGYAGEARAQPCTELLELLYETGAQLSCFYHTLVEITRVLQACSQRLQRGERTDVFGTIEYFIEHNYSDTDIQILINNMKTSLRALRITVKDKPPYEPRYVIDEAALGTALEEQISYRSPQARDRDVDSISAIMRLRHMNTYCFIEDCRAMFATTNKAVARVARSFFSDSLQDAFIPPCITDYSLTNLLWLKRPLKMPDLPIRRIIADCYAALQPDERLMRAYLSKIDRLQQERQITEDEVFLLRYSLEARQALMDLTSGDEQVFTNVSIQELLEIVRQKMLAEERAEIQAQAQREIDKLTQQRNRYKSLAVGQRAKLRQVEGQIQELTAFERTRNDRVSARAKRASLVIACFAGSLIIAGLIFGTIFLFPWELPSFGQAPLRYLLASSFVALTIFALTNLITGVHVLHLMRALSLRLEGPMRNLINRLSS